MQISHVLFRQTSHALHYDCDRNPEKPVRDHCYWMGILMMLVSKQTFKNIWLANCCGGETEPAGQTAMERRWRRSNIK